MMDSWCNWDRWRRHIERCTAAVTPKLVFGVCQALGLVGWVLTRRTLAPPAMFLDPTPIATDASLDRLGTVLCALLRFSRPKVQLQATKALISLVYARRRSNTEAMVLESTFVTAANFIPMLQDLDLKLAPKDAAVSASPVTANQRRTLSVMSARRSNDDNDVNSVTGDVAQDQIRFLQRSLLVLLWLLLVHMQDMQDEYDVAVSGSSLGRSLTDVTPLTASEPGKHLPGAGAADALEKIKQTIMHHADSTAEWLDAVTLDDTPIYIPLLSMTAPPLANTAPALSCGTSVQPEFFAREIVLAMFRVMHISADEDDEDTGVSAAAAAFDPRVAAQFTSAHLAMTGTTMEKLRGFARGGSASGSALSGWGGSALLRSPAASPSASEHKQRSSGGSGPSGTLSSVSSGIDSVFTASFGHAATGVTATSGSSCGATTDGTDADAIDDDDDEEI